MTSRTCKQTRRPSLVWLVIRWLPFIIGALAFAPLAPGCTVMAFAPQRSLDPALCPFESRYRHARLTTDWSLPFGDAAEGLRAAAASPLALYVTVPLLRWSEADVVPLFEWLLALPGLPVAVVGDVGGAAIGGDRHLVRQRCVQPASLIDRGELLQFLLRKVLKLMFLFGPIGAFGIPLSADRDVFANCH